MSIYRHKNIYCKKSFTFFTLSVIQDQLSHIFFVNNYKFLLFMVSKYFAKINLPFLPFFQKMSEKKIVHFLTKYFQN
jgi:hypothetical protein